MEAAANTVPLSNKIIPLKQGEVDFQGYKKNNNATESVLAQNTTLTSRLKSHDQRNEPLNHPANYTVLGSSLPLRAKLKSDKRLPHFNDTVLID